MLISDTRVVEVARVRAMVKRVHMSALKARFRPKKKARRLKAMIWLCGERCSDVAIWPAQEDVKEVVVLPRETFARY